MRALTLPTVTRPDYPYRRATLRRTPLGTWTLGPDPLLGPGPEAAAATGLRNRHGEADSLLPLAPYPVGAHPRR